MPKHGKEWENYFKKLKNSENDANIEFIFYQIKPIFSYVACDIIWFR
jgi:hypothetical protein